MPPPTEILPAGGLDRAALNAQVIAQLAKASVPTCRYLEELDQPDQAPHLVWPHDKTIKSLEGALAAPLRKRGAASFFDSDSFATYVLQHRTPGTHLTGNANEKGGFFHALLDYHTPHPQPDPAAAGTELPPASAFLAPRWAEHTATQTLEPTPEWARWLTISGKELDQKTFAEFLEDNSPDVIVPEGAAGKSLPNQQELMSVAATLQVKTDVQFASSVKLQNGQVQLGYTENIQGGHGTEGKLAIPEKFALAIAPFRGTAKYLVMARLRYRAASGKAIFRVEIERPHKIVESAFNDLRAIIEQATGYKVLVGTITPQTRPTL